MKTTGTEYSEFDFRGLTSVPPDFASWMLQREADGPLNIFEALKGLFSLLTG